MEEPDLATQNIHLKIEVDMLQRALSLSRNSERDITELYFTTLTLCLKLRATINGDLVTADLAMLREQAEHIPVSEWPRFLRKHIFKPHMKPFDVSGPEDTESSAPASRSWWDWSWIYNWSVQN